MVVGPAGSGKSTVVEEFLIARGGQVCYLATLPRLAFHQDRITKHQQRRPMTWTTIELLEHIHSGVECGIGAALSAVPPSVDVVLLDGLTMFAQEVGWCSPEEAVSGIIESMRVSGRSFSHTILVDQDYCAASISLSRVFAVHARYYCNFAERSFSFVPGPEEASRLEYFLRGAVQ